MSVIIVPGLIATYVSEGPSLNFPYDLALDAFALLTNAGFALAARHRYSDVVYVSQVRYKEPERRDLCNSDTLRAAVHFDDLTVFKRHLASAKK